MTLSPSNIEIDWGGVRDSLAALRHGHDSVHELISQLFDELESSQQQCEASREREQQQAQQLAEVHQTLITERAQWEALRSQPSAEQTGQILDLERERVQLETELESVRQRCLEMSETITEQKRQLAEERAEWTAEFRQLRKILDKQSQVLSTRLEAGPANGGTASLYGNGHPAEATSNGASNRANGENQHAVPVGAVEADPVLGSVISQFQMLQRDAARRRTQQTKKT
ncbi:MAG: hypothetical protein SGJ20_20695 [Planctomycetota bacterium]|nr:hypothetical protein [Planctomycetota bacterium]